MFTDPEGVDLDSYPIHVLTATLKAFFRDMPEPLMTFELYESFLLATSECFVDLNIVASLPPSFCFSRCVFTYPCLDFQDPEERAQAIFMETKKLPPAHYDLFERLAFHLARY